MHTDRIAQGAHAAAGQIIEPDGIDDLGGVFADRLGRGNAAVSDRDIGAHRVMPEPVDYYGIADREVMDRTSRTL